MNRGFPILGLTIPYLTFQEKLHRMLKEIEDAGESEIVSFFSHGRAFMVDDIDRFVASVMPRFFKQSKWNSFGTSFGNQQRGFALSSSLSLLRCYASFEHLLYTQ
jgi:hypothetical protein